MFRIKIDTLARVFDKNFQFLKSCYLYLPNADIYELFYSTSCKYQRFLTKFRHFLKWFPKIQIYENNLRIFEVKIQFFIERNFPCFDFFKCRFISNHRKMYNILFCDKFSMRIKDKNFIDNGIKKTQGDYFFFKRKPNRNSIPIFFIST